jgi:hypothetical protein
MRKTLSYQEVVEKFNSIKKPPRSKKYNEFQRPLRRVSENWLMLQKDPHSYVFKLVNTEAVRYFEPECNDKYQVAIRGMHSTFDEQQMCRYTGFYSGIKLRTTNGTEVRVPLNPNYKAQDKDFSALLTFTNEGLLIPEESWHADIYCLRSTDDDKGKRKKLKADLEAYVTLQQFKLPTIKESAKVSGRSGRPFGESSVSHGTRAKMFAFLNQDVLPLELPEFALLFDQVAQGCFDTLASKRIYATNHKLLYRSWNANPSEEADKREAQEDIIANITPEEFKESLVNTLLRIAGLEKGSSSVALPQFANTLPRSYYITAKGKS